MRKHADRDVSIFARARVKRTVRKERDDAYRNLFLSLSLGLPPSFRDARQSTSTSRLRVRCAALERFRRSDLGHREFTLLNVS